MSDQAAGADLIDLAADIVFAYVSNNTVPAFGLRWSNRQCSSRMEQYPQWFE